MSSIGIMDPAFFVGKNVLLKWINEFFQTNVQKVEEMANGALHCQILDAIYPGKVPLSKVNFDARTQPEFVSNFKVLQSVFDKEQISKHVDVPKLINAKFQDNLEFLQWMKQFFDKNYSGQEYNASERREEAKAGYKKLHKHAGGASKIAAPGGAKPAAPAAAAPKPAASAAAKPAAAAAKPAAKPATAASASASKTATAASSGSAAAKKPATSVAASPAKKPSTAKPSGTSSSKSDDEEVSKLKITVEGLEKERNFYFGKLREIEILCQNEDETDIASLKKAILDILYQTDGDEFQAPTEEEVTAGGATEENGEEAAAGGEEIATGGEAGLLDEAEIGTEAESF